MGTAPRMWCHKCQTEEKNHLPLSAKLLLSSHPMPVMLHEDYLSQSICFCSCHPISTNPLAHFLAKSFLTAPLAFSVWAALPSLVLSANLKFARSTRCSHLQEGRWLVNKDQTSLCLSVYNLGKQYFSVSLG